MYIPDKVYSENPFVDNIVYYAKLMALNCTVKDEEEALANETTETMYNGMVYIACIEKSARYELFKTIPEEIIEKYITPMSNLDIYASNRKSLRTRLESFKDSERNIIERRLSSLARTVYIDHYDTMTQYIQDMGETWLIDNQPLYDKCKSGEATYLDLFDELPMKTCLRIIRSYLNSHGYMDLAILWDPNSALTKLDLSVMEKNATQKANLGTYNLGYDESVRNILLDTDYLASVENYDDDNSTYKNQFLGYIATRDDTDIIIQELNNISSAMRQVFISHYEMMRDRKYFASQAEYNSEDIYGIEPNENGYTPAWMGYYFDRSMYEKAKAHTATWLDLYYLFPKYAINRILVTIFSKEVVDEYDLTTNSYNLDNYLQTNCPNATEKRKTLNKYFIDDYLANYQFFLNKSVYFDCKNEILSIYDLYDYLPYETLKSIINTEIEEVTNITVYSEEKKLLDSYLATLDVDEANRIRDGMTSDMIDWYPTHHIEKNNYYRTFLGLPPWDKERNRAYEDTLMHTWDDTYGGEFKEFGNRFLNMAPTEIYPTSHWKQELCKFDSYDISVLKDNGILDDLVTAAGSSLDSRRYRYIKYLGDDKLDLYICRKAMNFDLIGMPNNIDDLDIKKKFIDTYKVNQDMTIKTIYADAYRFQSENYPKFMIVFILMNTIMDLLTSIPDYIINRDVFDARCIQYLFESYGIPYYGEIPLKYQQRMLKNLNILIKYKSSTRNMVDICNLFGFADVRVFGYYMFKNRLLEDEDLGNYVLEEHNDISYELSKVYIQYDYGDIQDVSGKKFCKLTDYPWYDESYYLKEISVLKDDGSIETKKIINNERDELYVFDKDYGEMVKLKDTSYFTQIQANAKPAEIKFIKTPVEETITAYKKDNDYINDYDDITWEMTWDGGLERSVVHKRILDYEFNAVLSKYLSIDSVTSLTEITFQMSYFYNMLFDNLYGENLLTVDIPTIKSGHKFRLTDLIFFLFAATYYYHGLEDKIMYSPTQMLYVKGYNFDDALNTVLQDSKYFTQTTSGGKALEDSEKKNIFDINLRIAEDEYDYQHVMDEPQYYIRGYNLNANIDEINKWLLDEWQMSLSDIIVSDDIETFGQIVTLQQFFSLNNSYYQKEITSGQMTPLPYNNVLKYAYNYENLPKIPWSTLSGDVIYFLKEYIIDTTSPNIYNFVHDIVAIVAKYTTRFTYDELLERVQNVKSYDELKDYAYLLDNIFAVEDESEYAIIMEKMKQYYFDLLIEPIGDHIFVFNNSIYAKRANYHSDALYNRYIRSGNDYVLDDKQYYVFDRDLNRYRYLAQGEYFVKNDDGIYIFATDRVFKLIGGEYIEIDYNKYTYIDENDNKVLNYGNYYILNDEGNWILDPENAYVRVRKPDGTIVYVLFKDIDQYDDITIDEAVCFIRHSDGHFIPFDYTDYYIRTHNDWERANELLYNEEELYIQWNTETDYYDPSLPEEDRVYYKPLSEYYKENDFRIYTDMLYVKDSEGNYIPEEELLSPLNTWYYDVRLNKWKLIMSELYEYTQYENPENILYIMVLQSNYDYLKYALDSSTNTYKYVPIADKRYVVNSDRDYITMLYNLPRYNDTSKLIVVLNTEILTDKLAEETRFNPSLKDNVWDENDWYYDQPGYDPNNAIEMHGENIWYYRDPTKLPVNPNSVIPTELGSGFYFDSISYIGDSTLTKGEEYYMLMDIETNFDGFIQIYCSSDKNIESPVNRVYYVKKNEKQHIQQIIKAKESGAPQVRFLKYDFENNPIYIGDYIVVSNLKFYKAYSEHYIPRDIPSIDKLELIYKTNKEIYKYLLTKMQETSDKKTFDVYKKLYDSLMLSKYNKEIFKISENTYATSYTEFLKGRDEILYSILLHFRSLDQDAMRDEISNDIVEICYALSKYLSDDFKYIYAYFPAVGISFIQHYIFKIIDWFRSWKTHLIGINTLYVLGKRGITDGTGALIDDMSGDDFTVKVLHDQDYKIKIRDHQKDGFVNGTIKINPIDAVSPGGTPYSEIFDFSDTHNIIRDWAKVRDRIRIIVRSGNRIKFINDRGQEMHIILNDDSTKITVENGNILTAQTINGDGFSTANRNELILTTDEDPEDMFASQILDEINLLSGDFNEIEAEEEDTEEDERQYC